MKKNLLLFSILFFATTLFAAPPVDNHIKIDQFGYRTSDKKIAVISNPITGYNNNSAFTPGTTYEVKRFSDDVTVLTNL